jgi:hypothetical protein
MGYVYRWHLRRWEPWFASFEDRLILWLDGPTCVLSVTPALAAPTRLPTSPTSGESDPLV